MESYISQESQESEPNILKDLDDVNSDSKEISSTSIYDVSSETKSKREEALVKYIIRNFYTNSILEM